MVRNASSKRTWSLPLPCYRLLGKVGSRRRKIKNAQIERKRSNKKQVTCRATGLGKSANILSRSTVKNSKRGYWRGIQKEVETHPWLTYSPIALLEEARSLDLRWKLTAFLRSDLHLSTSNDRASETSSKQVSAFILCITLNGTEA
jgi:hypothetical protein